MSEISTNKKEFLVKAAAIAVAVAILYANVLVKLGRDWWLDENYSHALLVPFVIAIIIWLAWQSLKMAADKPSALFGSIAVLVSMLLLVAGTLGAELFTQRISLVLMLAGIVVYLFGTRLLQMLAVPFALLLFSIPIPQIVFNRIAFPLQLYASQTAVWGMRVFGIPTVRMGNIIDILPRGSTQTISLQVVEACSGIRSLMTLVTLALVFAYFTRDDRKPRFGNLSTTDLARAAFLMIVAVPIAVLTNAARVTATGILTYYYGIRATENTWHEFSGWLVYVVALALLFGASVLFRRVAQLLGFGSSAPEEATPAEPSERVTTFRRAAILPLIAVLVSGAVFINWFMLRGEAAVDRKPLTSFPSQLGQWRQKGSDIHFDADVEDVLKTTDYTMREYTAGDGRLANVYVGYYASQRTGATYHSPQNCLPGAGWVMNDPQYITITTPSGRTFTANRYIVENGIYKEVMIYWYQGRGRTEASEYRDKINTIVDSMTRSRTDGAIIRVMTDLGSDEPASLSAAADLAARVEDELPSFVPE
jgi:exosortase D (VPLPA-CTERM-specific)